MFKDKDIFMLLVLPTGQTLLLICISGTITVMSAQNDFRPIEVPIEIWIPHRYPHEPPYFHVRLDLLPQQVPPLMIRETSISDKKGIIDLPGTFNTLQDALLQLQNDFSAELPIVSAPPVYNATSTSSPVTEIPDQTEVLKTKLIDKITAKLRAQSNNTLANPLADTNSRLLQSKKDREREKMALNNEINLINKELEALKRKSTELQSWIAKAENFNELEKVLVPADQKTAKLADLLALESALNDALLAVMKKMLNGFSQSELTLANALRSIRDLSRRHFLTKFEIRKLVGK